MERNSITSGFRPKQLVEMKTKKARQRISIKR